MIKNDKQIYFNRVKGKVSEIEINPEFSSITLDVGHANMRQVNLCFKTVFKETLLKNVESGDSVVAQFYISSNRKHERWYTTATLLSLEKNYEN
jgi:hypothetical protein